MTGDAGAPAYLGQPFQIDLDDTTHCPIAAVCDCCGSGTGERVVVTAGAGSLGVLCLTACATCIDSGCPMPRTPVGAAARMVAEHAEHLGIDLDVMAAAIGGER